MRSQLDELAYSERRVAAAELRRYDPAPKPGWDTFRMDSQLAIVGAGVLPDAKAVGLWLSRKQLSYGAHHDGSITNVVAHLVFVLSRRVVSWLPRLIDELASRLSIDPRMYYSNPYRID